MIKNNIVYMPGFIKKKFLVLVDLVDFGAFGGS